MKIIIQTPGFKASQKLQSFVREKLEKLEELYPKILEARVVLRLDKSEDQQNKASEIILSVRGKDLFASKQTDTFEESVTKVTTALRRQLAAAKSKPAKVAAKRRAKA
jgi:ribosomal subunit interface protein